MYKNKLLCQGLNEKRVNGTITIHIDGFKNLRARIQPSPCVTWEGMSGGLYLSGGELVQGGFVRREGDEAASGAGLLAESCGEAVRGR